MLLQTVKFYFAAVENFNERSELLDKMGAKYGVKFSEEDKVVFQNSSNWSSDESAKEFSLICLKIKESL